MRQNVFVRIFAAIMRVCFPLMAVKYFTKKTNKHAELFLPSEAKQLKAIEKLDLDTDQIRARVWSLQVKVARLQQRHNDLIQEIKTEQEFSALVERAHVDIVAQAMKFYTPTQEMALRLLSQFGLDAVELINKAPAAFDGLKASDILSVKPNEVCAPDSPRWAFAEALVSKRSSWALKFLDELRKMPPQRLGELGKAKFNFFFKFAYEAKENVAFLMPYMAVFFPELYAQVRANFFLYKEFAPYITKMLPAKLRYLDKGRYSFLSKGFSQISVEGQLDEVGDAYAWLSIAYYRMNEPAVYELIISKMSDIKPMVSESIYSQLLDRLIALANCPADVSRLLSLADDKRKQVLYHKMVEKKYAVLLAAQYPFSSWEDKELIKSALRIVITDNHFPLAKMHELPEDLQEFATYQMEVSAQIAALKSDIFKNVGYHLLPEVEIYLVLMDPRYSLKYQKLYVDEFKLSEKAFNALIHRETVKLQDQVVFPDVLVGKYAAKWGLTDEQYQALLQTPMKKYTLQWKEYIKKPEVSHVYHNETEG